MKYPCAPWRKGNPEGVDLCTEEGKVTGIIGPNGCGKSTLIKTTFGLVKPVQGRILVGEREAMPSAPGKWLPSSAMWVRIQAASLTFLYGM